MSTNATSQIQMITDNSVLVHLDFRQWTGACSFTPQDLGEMPPKELVAAMGQKRLVDPKVLGAFSRIKERATGVLDNNGTPFLKGWLVPVDRAPQVIEALDKLKAEYEAEKEVFLRNLPSAYDEWAKVHPEFSRFIQTARKAVEDVARRIHASYCVCAFAASGIDVNNSLSDEVLGLKDEIIKDVATRCRKLADQSLIGKDTASHRIRNVLVTLHSKITGLSYVDNSLSNLQRTLADLILMTPEKGAVQGRLLSAVTTGVAMLSSRSRIEEICQGTASFATTLKSMGLDDLIVHGTPVTAPPYIPKARKPVVGALETAPTPQGTAVYSSDKPTNPETPMDDLFADLDAIFEGASTQAKADASETDAVVKPVLQPQTQSESQQETAHVSQKLDEEFVPPPPPEDLIKGMFI